MNIVIVILVALGLWLMLSGRDGTDAAFSEHGFKAFKFYTVLSNLLVGLAAAGILLCRIFGGDLLCAYGWKYAGAVSVTLTFLVTAFFLAPAWPGGWKEMYQGSNFFFHLVVPVLSVVSFAGWEKAHFPFAMTFVATVPTVLYAAYYIANALPHARDGHVPPEYDWYGFFRGGTKTAPAVAALIIGITWLMAVAIWWLNSL